VSDGRQNVPSPNDVDHWVKVLDEDAGWLWDHEARRCGPYRWLFSGLGASSGTGERVSGGNTPDPTRRHAAEGTAARLRTAGWLLHDAQGLVRQARHLLTLEDRIDIDDGGGVGYVNKKERKFLLEKQAQRRKNGSGYGDG
jgi:hypothetical protein